MRRLALIGLLPGLLLTARADIFVDGSAGPGGDGSTAHPFAAIQQGLDHAKAGDSVIVRPGVYHEQIKLNHGGTAQAPRVNRRLRGPTARTAPPGAPAVNFLPMSQL